MKCLNEKNNNYKVTSSSGIYVARILSSTPMPVTRDKRYVNICATVDKYNIKIGKAKNLKLRESNYWKDFDKNNVIFRPLAVLDDIQKAETSITQSKRRFNGLA